MNKTKREAVRENLELAKSIIKIVCDIDGPNEFSKYKANLWLRKANYGPGKDGEYDDYFYNTARLLDTIPNADKLLAGIEAVYYNEDADFHTIKDEDMDEVILQILIDDEKDEEISPEVQQEIDEMMKEIDEEIAAEEAAENKEDPENDLTDDDKEVIFATGMSTEDDPPADSIEYTTTFAISE